MNSIRSDENIIKTARTEIFGGFSVLYTLYEETDDPHTIYSVKAISIPDGEASIIRSITCDKDKAVLIFDMLCRGGVTPCCLAEITEDLIESLP